ncbi:MAG: cytochrome C oxidase subunit II [Epsilonproteobacteria bacterium]|nr:cytochrome C oxidase subunit II [Campylobacterota bacterium]
MATTHEVLGNLKLVYTIYALFIISLVGWFAYRVTKPPTSTKTWITPKVFYSYLALLVLTGVGIHILTYNKIPWVAWELKKHMIKPDKVVEIKVKDHKFILPDVKPIVLECNEKVKFNVTSDDLTYGFGVFRKDNSMVFQMQVIPKYNNEILWTFTESGNFDIMSTEYSGPKGNWMKVENAIRVNPCYKKVALKESK